MPAAIPVATMALGALGASQQADAAKSAASAQKKASMAGIAEERRQFDIAQEQFAPYREAGGLALQSQQALLGLLGPEAQQQAFQQYTESPGQAFLRQRGEQALLRNASATGGLGGGNILTALQQQGMGFAQQDLQNQLARLSSLSEAGRGAVGTQAGLGAQSASNIASLMGQAGQARASGILGAQQAQQQLLGQVGGGLIGAAAGSGMLGAPMQTAYGGSGSAGAVLGML